jgi:predicted nucleic acid-binding protein
MNFLVDTNVIAEWVKPRPNPGVVAWLADTKEDRVFLSGVALTDAKMGPEGADQESPGLRPISANPRRFTPDLACSRLPGGQHRG